MSTQTEAEKIASLEKRIADLEAQVRMLNMRPNYPPPPLTYPQQPSWPTGPAPYWLQRPTCTAD